MQRSLKVVMFAFVMAWGGLSLAQNSEATNEIQIAGFQGRVELAAAGATAWSSVQTNQVVHPHDRLRTGLNSRVALRWSDQSVVPFGASTELEIMPPNSADAQAGLHLIRGIISFFHRDQPGRIQIITRGTVAGVEGTEFVLAVDDADRTTLSVIDGKVQFGNTQGTLVLTNGEQAAAVLGQAPVRTPGFIANNLLQWCFYYPAVLDLNELSLSPADQSSLTASLDAYRDGDLPAALAKFPPQPPASAAAVIYHAALLLSVGEVDGAEKILGALADNSDRTQRLAAALHELIAAVKRQTFVPNPAPKLATEFLAESYYEQSLAVRGSSLERALKLAGQAVTVSPGFGFARERVAELDFSFGRTEPALVALNESLAQMRRNPEALALKGFLLAAQNQTRAALSWFDRALAVDPALGNAWLGRGLCKIRLGDAPAGREDLLMAAALEPQRATLRSYLGKAYANAGDFPRATKELELAKKLDPNDPTAWLYSALLHQERNQINDAIRDLEKSAALNDNRSVYRSRLLLDQDQAVRRASLAAMYRDAGMTDVSLHTAARAVNYDYGNYAAHLFLADSYNALIDPNEINLRYETPAASEYLLANLLAPASAGSLSPIISQQEYSRLFQRDGFGVASETEYLSRGAWTEAGAQFGTFGNFNYDFESFYHSDRGQRLNNDLEQRQLRLSLKGQLTPQDSIYGYVQTLDQSTGDLTPRYDPNVIATDYRAKETQEPFVGIGYHHEWSPGVHTLFLANRLQDTVNFKNFFQPALELNRPDDVNGNPFLSSVINFTLNEHYTNQLEIYSMELQQIWEQAAHTTIAGARVQYGHFDTAIYGDNPFPLAAVFPSPPAPSLQQDVSSLFKRISFYGYHQWQIFEPLQLIGGVTYDRMAFSENFLTAPISNQQTRPSQVSPKAGLIWRPAKDTAVRFAYTRSLSGASLDQSDQLEPSQVAGFIQSYRSIIPEAIVGGTSGAQFETYDVILEQKFSTGTYLSLSGEMLNSTVHRVAGAFDYLVDEQPFPIPTGLREKLDYREMSAQFTANQLLGREWSLGARYRISQADLLDDFVDIPDKLPFIFPYSLQPRQRTKALLNRLDLTANYNHPCGFFATGGAQWFGQCNHGYAPAEPGDSFWQFNLYAGYRSPRRRMELTVGLLNLAGQDYRLNPLNLYNELPHTRTVSMRLKFNF